MDSDDCDEYDEYESDSEYEDSESENVALIATTAPPTPKYDLLDRRTIWSMMDEHLQSLHGITGLSYTTLRVLLNRFKWDKNRLLEKFYDCPAKLFTDANIHQASESEMKPTSGQDDAECTICLCEVESQHLVYGVCGMYFCKECYTEYARVQIHEGASELLCPGYKCNAYIEDDTIFALFDFADGAGLNEKTKEKYRRQISEAYVICNRALLHCTTPDCQVVLHIGAHDHNVGLEVKCQCGQTLCSSCGEKWHDPVKCQLLKLWKKKCDDDSETYNWIHANTKECPKCKATIEKDGGCNHVVCRNQACRYEFCWVCMTGWEHHGSAFYNCNRYQDGDTNTVKSKQESSRAALERYLFYYNRYHNHAQSLKKENKLRTNVKRKMDSLMERDMSWVEVQFLHQAVETLQQSRQILMFTYVFAFYLQRSNPTEIFETNQVQGLNSSVA